MELVVERGVGNEARVERARGLFMRNELWFSNCGETDRRAEGRGREGGKEGRRVGENVTRRQAVGRVGCRCKHSMTAKAATTFYGTNQTPKQHHTERGVLPTFSEWTTVYSAQPPCTESMGQRATTSSPRESDVTLEPASCTTPEIWYPGTQGVAVNLLYTPRRTCKSSSDKTHALTLTMTC